MLLAKEMSPEEPDASKMIHLDVHSDGDGVSVRNSQFLPRFPKLIALP